jgi:hypothetical protein
MTKGNWQQQLYDDVMKRRGQGAAPVSSPKPKRTPKNDYKATFLLHLKFAKLPEPVSEYQFHETRKWRFDFCWPEQKVAVEYQGLNWQRDGDNSGHQSIAGLMRDCEKFTEASLAGWTLILITAESVDSGQAVEWVRRAFTESEVTA